MIVMRKVAYVVSALILTGCGGGGGSGSSPTPTAALSVTLTASTTSPYQGDQVTLSWSASNATSCSASGNWTGTISTNGSQLLTITNLGDQTYTITCNGNGQSTTSSVTINAKEKPYFLEVADSFPDPTNNYWFFNTSRPDNTFAGSAVASAAIDMNSDGRKEFLLVIWKGTGHDVNRGKYVSEPCKSTTVIYENVNGKFVDNSDKYLESNRDFGACVDINSAQIDINNDGKEDIFFSAHQEDGRNPDLGSKMDSQLVGWISQPNGKYRIIKFGPSLWYHSIGAGIDSDGKPFVTGAGYPNNTIQNMKFKWDGRDLVNVNDGMLPNISPVTFVFKSINDKTSDVLIQHTWDITMGAEAYVKQNMVWRYTNRVNLPLTYLRDENLTLFSGDVRKVKVFDFNGISVLGTGGGSNLENLCLLKMYKDKPPVAVGTYQLAKIKNYVPNQGIKNDDVYGELMPTMFSVENGVFTYKVLPIKNETNLTFGKFQCIDVNKDGYEDLTIGLGNDRNINHQRIYINNKDGSFTKLNLGSNVLSLLDHVGMYHSLADDFDNDGKVDVIVYASNITNNKSLNGAIKFYKGFKTIE